MPSLEYLTDTTAKMTVKNHVDFLRQSQHRHMNHTPEQVMKDMVSFLDQYLIRRKKTTKGLDPRYLSWIEEVRKDVKA